MKPFQKEDNFLNQFFQKQKKMEKESIPPFSLVFGKAEKKHLKMKKHFPFEFIYQVFSLLVIIIIVHAAYVAIIRPNAEAELEQQAAQLKIDKDYAINQLIKYGLISVLN